MPDFVKLDTKTFKSKKEAKEFFQRILHSYEAGERVKEDDGKHLHALLKRHNEYTQKVGCGISHFEVMKTRHGSNCFKIIRNDGSGTDFSFYHCIKQRPATQKQAVSKAFREAVRYDLYRAREKYISENKNEDGTIECAISKERIQPEDAHMDHRPPMTFEVIVETFLKARNLNYEDVKLSKGADNQTIPEIIDWSLEAHFKNYHAQTAKISLVKASINLSQSAPNRIKKGQLHLGGWK